MPALALEEVAEAARPRLVALAYRMLGSMSDAEDVVQDALVKAHRAAPSDLDAPEAYLTTITTRTAIDYLRSARVRREAYVGPWLPEPVLEDPAPDVAARAVINDSISMAFLVVLESLSPDERAALLLHDVFGYRHAEVARLLDRSEAACRQLLRSARRRIEAERPRFEVARDRHERLVRQFLDAVNGGSLEDFLGVLTEDATLVSDGGASVKAARRPITGARRIARFLSSVLYRGDLPLACRRVVVNGDVALALLSGGRLTTVVFLDGDEQGRIDTLWFVRNPAKLARIRVAIERSGDGP
jgi:RNA polymerase sigma-70 factor (ECF subfamily)